MTLSLHTHISSITSCKYSTIFKKFNSFRNPEGFHAGNGRFKVGFGLQNSETAEHILNQQIYGARAKYVYRSIVNGVSKTLTFSAKIKPCDPNYFGDLKKEDNKIVKNLYCLSEDQAVLPQIHQDMKITGRFDSDTQGKLSLSIERCKEDCLPDDEIDKFLNKANVAVYFTNYSQQLNSNQEPYKKVLEGLFSSVDSEFAKNHEIFMKKSSVESNKGFLLPRISNTNYHLMERQKETVSSSRNGNLYNLIFQMSTVDEQHSRKSKKIFSVIATMGGYLKAFVLFFYLYKPFLERKYYIELINHLYHVAENKDKDKNQKPGSKSTGSKSSDKEEIEMRKSRLLSWRPFSRLFSKKSKKTKENQNNTTNNMSLGADLSAINLRESQALSANQIDSDEDSDNTSESSENENLNEIEEEEMEDEKILKYSLRDWIAIFIPFLRSKNHYLYVKVRFQSSL